MKDVQIVVSTHAVLADALSHGFVGMWKLALLIFDEGEFDDHGKVSLCYQNEVEDSQVAGEFICV